MCVIIYREPGVVIPHEKLVSACIVNQDGMGIITVDRGKMELRKHFDPKGNDPDTLARAMEQGKDLPMWIHLRYMTKGATDKYNVHPFGVLKEKKHGMDLQFMHNGTLSDFGNSSDCDSKDFVKKLLTPLCEKLMAAVGPEALTKDETLREILKKYAGRNSYFMMVDNFGNYQMIADDKGYQHEGWWSSNVYSFNRTHREPTVIYQKPSTNYRENWEKMYGAGVQEEPKKLYPIKTFTGGITYDAEEVPFETEETKEVAKTPPANPISNTYRERFTEIAGITQLSDVCSLTDDDIDELVIAYPGKAKILILDLLYELYGRDREYDDTADYLRSVA